MSEVGDNGNSPTEPCTKKLKSSLTFWSPLNESFGLPNKKSQCTWHAKVDRSTNPHNSAEQ